MFKLKFMKITATFKAITGASRIRIMRFDFLKRDGNLPVHSEVSTMLKFFP